MPRSLGASARGSGTVNSTEQARRFFPVRPRPRADRVVEVDEPVAVVFEAVVAGERRALLRCVARAIAAGIGGIIDDSLAIVVDAVVADVPGLAFRRVRAARAAGVAREVGDSVEIIAEAVLREMRPRGARIDVRDAASLQREAERAARDLDRDPDLADELERRRDGAGCGEPMRMSPLPTEAGDAELRAGRARRSEDRRVRRWALREASAIGKAAQGRGQLDVLSM